MPELQGTYIFADFINARIWALLTNGQEIIDYEEITDELAPDDGRDIGRISSFGEDNAGELYIIDYGDGEIFKIVPPA
jgi:hypothetical protein